MFLKPRPRHRSLLAAAGLAAFSSIPGALAQQPQPGSPYVVVPNPWPYPERVAMTIRGVLPDVEGKIDHMAVDAPGARVFICATGHNSLQVFSLDKIRVTQQITDLSEPHSVVFDPAGSRVIVSCGGDSTCRVFVMDQSGTLTPHRTVQFQGETTHLRYDPASRLAYVATGTKIAAFSPDTGDVKTSIEFDEVPAAFLLVQPPGAPPAAPASTPNAPGKDAAPQPPAGASQAAPSAQPQQETKSPAGVVKLSVPPAATRMYVCLPRAGAVAVVDLAANKIEKTWTLDTLKFNYAIALDPATQRLFVPCRQPAKVAVLDTTTGKPVALLDCAKDADDVWFDALSKRLMITGGDAGGKITILKQESADTYAQEILVSTAAGARTSVLSPERRQLIVCAPKIGGTDPTFVYVYMIGP